MFYWIYVLKIVRPNLHHYINNIIKWEIMKLNCKKFNRDSINFMVHGESVKCFGKIPEF